MPISGEFATALQRLLEKLQQDQAEIDFQEQIKRRLFGTQESQLNEAHPLALRTSNQNLADRGLVQSGIGLGQHGNINRAFMENLAGLRQENTEDLSSFAKQRLSNQATYNWNFADLQRQWAQSEAEKAATGMLGNPNPVAPTAPAVTPPAATGVIPGVPKTKPRTITPKKPTPKKPVKKVVPTGEQIKPRPLGNTGGKPAGLTSGLIIDKIKQQGAKNFKNKPVIGARGGY